MIYLVGTEWIATDIFEPHKAFTNKEKARQYIKDEMEGKKYNGLGFYKIMEVPLID